MQRRIASLWFPHLAAERALRSDGAHDPARPFVVVRSEKSALRLCSVNRIAAATGLALGSTLTDMRAICPDLASIQERPEKDEAFLQALARWGLNFTPWAALDGHDGLMLDMTGSAHLFGGEDAFLSLITARLEALGLTVRAGLADTKGAAWALARFAPDSMIAPAGCTREAIVSLPVSALRIEQDTATALNRLGLRQIGDIAGMPRGALARRFGQNLVRRLDQMMGAEPEPVAPSVSTPLYAVRLLLPEPIGKTEDVAAALDRLLVRLCERLERDQRGARQVRFSIQRSDHSEDTVEISLARPSHEPTRIAKLFEHGINALEARFGIDAVRLHAITTEPLAPEQSTSLSRQSPDQDAVSHLIARIGNRVGFDRVTRFIPAESHVPERAFTIAAAAYSQPEQFPENALHRPALLFSPEPLDPVEGDKPPRVFRWRGIDYDTRHATGPERIAPEWWWDDPNWRNGARDYWCVQTAQGRRLWLFQTYGCTQPGGDRRAGWFAHGEFA